MRTKRSAQSESAAPISAALAGRARRTTEDDPDGDGRAQLLRVVALLGIGLVAAAILLPSGEPAIVVPADTLQPATAQAAGDAPAGADATRAPDEDDRVAPEGATAKARSAARFATGSSAAAVVGDDLAAAAASATMPAKGAGTPTSKAKSSTAKRRAKRSAPKKRWSKRATPATTAPATPPPAATPPAATPVPAASAPAPRRSRGGPKAEFGGL